MIRFGVQHRGLVRGTKSARLFSLAMAIGPAIVWSLNGWGAETPTPSKLPPVAEREVDYEVDVLPILVGKCFACHGSQKQEGGLRLDNRESAHNGGDSGTAFELGKSGESLLVKYVSGVDPDQRMPPEGELLSAGEVGILRRWIDGGATYPAKFASKGGSGADHWSFRPISRPVPPETERKDWCRNPIDQFVLSRLEREGILPSPEAGRETLVRRLYLDLTGLPPTVEAVDAFVADSRENAYELLVDELLSSPHFGERWGRHWLDLARYADSDGYEKDRVRPHAWRYRNWVIDSINRDQPFDQFTIEQLAGDLFPEGSQEQKIATGFHRNTLTNTEGGVDQEEYRVAATVDRVNTIGGAWLGLTLGCAQCHSHKYDPITQREYYELFAYFNSIDEVNIPAPTETESKSYAESKPKFDVEHKRLLDELQKYDADMLPGLQRSWENEGLNDVPLWVIEEPIGVSSANGAIFRRRPDGSVLVDGPEPERDEYTILMETRMPSITGLRIEVLPDETLYRSSSARGESQEFVLSEVEVGVATDERKERDQLQSVRIKRATSDFAFGSTEKMNLTGAELAIDGKPETGWSTSGENTKPHSIVLEFEQPIEYPGGAWLSLKLSQQAGEKKNLGRFRISLTDRPGGVSYHRMPDDVAWGLKAPEERRTGSQQEGIKGYFRTVDPGYVEQKRLLDEHAKAEPVLTQTQAQVVAERSERRKTHLLTRGDFLRPGTEVGEGVPSVLSGGMKSPDIASRLEFAKWLVHPDHPLTARVTINRWWKDLFGQPLVMTIEDFGTRGESPTHPALLDWLAAQLIERGWGRKEMLRLIVNSATYRQSSVHRQELEAVDPKNYLLSRQNRFRVEAEGVRDLYLAASGLMHPKIGGPSIRPPLPAGIAELGYAGGHQWPVTPGEDQYRRGMYIFMQRTVPYPMLTTFDAPDSTTSCLRRERTNTPLQALTLLNDPVFVECAQELGVKGAILYPDDASKRVEWMFRRCVSRVPGGEEIERLTRFYGEIRGLAEKDPAAAKEIVGTRMPQSEPGSKIPVEDLAASAAVARIVMNLEEFVVRE